jgi:hypothetical protein
MKYHPILKLVDPELRAARAAKPSGRVARRRRALPPTRTGALRDYALWLADRVAASGIRGCEVEVQRLVRAARHNGIDSVATDVVADPAEAAVARERALGHLITAIFQAPEGLAADAADAAA